MIETILKDVQDREVFIDKAIKLFETGEGEVPEGLQGFYEEIKPYFGEDKYFVEAVRKNSRRLKDKFEGDELGRALSWKVADKKRDYYLQRLKEAKGFRELAQGRFGGFKIIAFRKETVISKESIVEKISYINPFMVVTTSTGFRNVMNPYLKIIINEVANILHEIKKKGYYDTEMTNIVLKDEESGKEIALKIACNAIR